jgi:hypothetical protein
MSITVALSSMIALVVQAGIHIVSGYLSGRLVKPDVLKS